MSEMSGRPGLDSLLADWRCLRHPKAPEKQGVFCIFSPCALPRSLYIHRGEQWREWRRLETLTTAVSRKTALEISGFRQSPLRARIHMVTIVDMLMKLGLNKLLRHVFIYIYIHHEYSPKSKRRREKILLQYEVLVSPWNTSWKTGNHFKIWKQCTIGRGILILHGTSPEVPWIVSHSGEALTFFRAVNTKSRAWQVFHAHPDYTNFPEDILSKIGLKLWIVVWIVAFSTWAIGVFGTSPDFGLPKPPRPSQEASIQTSPRGAWHFWWFPCQSGWFADLWWSLMICDSSRRWPTKIPA